MKNLIAATALSIFPFLANAQACAPYDAVKVELSETHGEYRTMTVMNPDGMLIEVWHNPQSETWTMIMVGPNGMACLLAEGQCVMMSVMPNV